MKIVWYFYALTPKNLLLVIIIFLSNCKETENEPFFINSTKKVSLTFMTL